MVKVMNIHQKAFTLVEILIVIIIVGIVAGFGIPNFSKSIGRSRVRDAMNNLSVIHAANAIYEVRNNANVSGDLDAINDKLKLNIISSGGTIYQCSTGICTATSAAGTSDFVVTMNLNAALEKTNLVCSPSSSSSCP
ncbi:MAG: prepilin-type N-terminal cleavage/methylation domain-containing protein [Candidatus Omnitrophica bacterium]|nr:prepilin-type N-terminal cleavage/methylation domain-containing protein [Candidatus Omnitrophota bacterium]